jgi:hypothetical protein
MPRLRDAIQGKRSSRSLGSTESKLDSITFLSKLETEVVRLEPPMCQFELDRCWTWKSHVLGYLYKIDSNSTDLYIILYYKSLSKPCIVISYFARIRTIHQKYLVFYFLHDIRDVSFMSMILGFSPLPHHAPSPISSPRGRDIGSKSKKIGSWFRGHWHGTSIELHPHPCDS